MSETAEILSSTLPDLATTIRREGLEWLRENRPTVEHWSREAGADIADAIRFDLWEPVPVKIVRADVVIPFCEADSRFVAEAVQSIIDQRHCIPTIHLISDGAEWPDLPTARPAVRVKRYETGGGWGPYRITNSVVAGGHCETDFLAIQDADDIATPDRLWRQIAILEHHGADMIGGAMTQFFDPSATPEARRRAQAEPVMRSGSKFASSPNGRTVNSTRTITLSTFVELRGFTNLVCGADFDLDNRVHYAGGEVIHDSTVVGRRRLHGSSLTSGDEYRIGSDARNRSNQIVLDILDVCRSSPSLETSRRFGALDVAEKLKPTSGLRNRCLIDR